KYKDWQERFSIGKKLQTKIIMESLSAYIPTDRRFALARGIDLASYTTGAALFADISGFTPLAEALVQALGPQRGAEELTLWLNKIYDALVTEISSYRGSVISFSGDAITCWFDDTNSRLSAALRGTASALAIQRAMQQFAQVDISGAGTVSLAIKVVVTAGSARRFLIGDPAIQLVDALAGETLYRLAEGEHLAHRAEVLLDQPAVTALGEQIEISEWIEDPRSGERFAIITRLKTNIGSDPWPPLEPDELGNDLIRPWLLPAVYERLMSGMGEFLTELRPTVALFVRFSGIDYDEDPHAQSKLNAYIQDVQRILARYDSYMLQLTIGDKGSNFYAAFGAPLAHEDDAIRAVAAALELRDLQLDFIQDV
ncbi:MAG TPA: adenylate/guanylate cyclase domain-containing protein, partial [Gammaproteobacteria bacterium]|nr:adenylate/guanylate cyclase domain-containing protein [Gammaproteobacteria bacterium]